MAKVSNVVECPKCSMPIRLWEHFSVNDKGYIFPNREKVDGKPFYVCRTCGYFLFTGEEILTWEGGEWIPFKQLVKFIFR